MRVALDGTALIGARTGVGAVVEALTFGLAAHDDVDLTSLIVSRRAGSDLATRLPMGVDVLRLRTPARVCHRLWRRFDHPAVTGFDVVHGPNYVVPPAGGGAELVTIHDFTPWRYPHLVTGASRNVPQLVDAALDRGAHVHTVSQFVADEAIDHLVVDSDRVHAIANGVVPPAIGTPQAGSRMARGHPYVLAIGTIEPRKDYPTLVAAFAAVCRHHPDLRLVIVGEDGWGVDAFRSAVEANGVGNAIIRLGYVDESTKADLLAGAAVFAYPSLYEGFGLPPLEAASVGIPVVATAAGSIPEVMGEGALLVEVGDVDALASALVTALTDEGERGRLIAAGAARANCYRWDDAVEQLVLLYRQLSI